MTPKQVMKLSIALGCQHGSSQKNNPNKEKYLVESLTITMAEKYRTNREKIEKVRICWVLWSLVVFDLDDDSTQNDVAWFLMGYFMRLSLWSGGLD